MNRFRKEALTKHKAILENCSPLEMKRFEKDERIKSKIIDLARQIHIDKYPEEYCHIFDDHVDYRSRKRGINPMSDGYAATVAHKRAKLGVSPLSENGMPVSGDTWKIAYANAEDHIRN